MTTINYHPKHLSGSKCGVLELIEGTQDRIYARGNEYKMEDITLFADFDFVWHCGDMILTNYKAEWPILLMSVNDVFDYNAFISLN